jgi:hypothetical protein
VSVVPIGVGDSGGTAHRDLDPLREHILGVDVLAERLEQHTSGDVTPAGDDGARVVVLCTIERRTE